MEDFKEKLKSLERLSLDPFNPEPLRKELEDILEKVPQMSKEELEELSLFFEKLKKRLEENYRICFGWMDDIFKKGFRKQA